MPWVRTEVSNTSLLKSEKVMRQPLTAKMKEISYLDSGTRKTHDVFDVLALATNDSTYRLFRYVQVHNLQLLLLLRCARTWTSKCTRIIIPTLKNLQASPFRNIFFTCTWLKSAKCKNMKWNAVWRGGVGATLCMHKAAIYFREICTPNNFQIYNFECNIFNNGLRGASAADFPAVVKDTESSTSISNNTMHVSWNVLSNSAFCTTTHYDMNSHPFPKDKPS